MHFSWTLSNRQLHALTVLVRFLLHEALALRRRGARSANSTSRFFAIFWRRYWQTKPLMLRTNVVLGSLRFFPLSSRIINKVAFPVVSGRSWSSSDIYETHSVVFVAPNLDWDEDTRPRRPRDSSLRCTVAAENEWSSSSFGGESSFCYRLSWVRHGTRALITLVVGAHSRVTGGCEKASTPQSAKGRLPPLSDKVRRELVDFEHQPAFSVNLDEPCVSLLLDAMVSADWRRVPTFQGHRLDSEVSHFPGLSRNYSMKPSGCWDLHDPDTAKLAQMDLLEAQLRRFLTYNNTRGVRSIDGCRKGGDSTSKQISGWRRKDAQDVARMYEQA